MIMVLTVTCFSLHFVLGNLTGEISSQSLPPCERALRFSLNEHINHFRIKQSSALDSSLNQLVQQVNSLVWQEAVLM